MSNECPQATSAERPFQVMTKPNGPACNLECEYCFYLEKADLYPERSDFGMCEDDLETFVQQYIESQPGSVVTFAWQGGEPTLLGLDFFRHVVELQREHAPDDVCVENVIQTNGTMLDEEWCRFLADHEFLVGISIDGPRNLHDRYRQTRAGGGTFDAVMDGLDLLQEYGVDHNVLCVVNAVNSRRPLEVYDFFRERGVEWLQFIPLVEPLADNAGTETSKGYRSDATPDIEDIHTIPEWVRDRGGDARQRDDSYEAVLASAREASVSERSVDPAAFGAFACAVFDEWVRNDVGDVSVQLFDQCLEVLFQGEASLCTFRETCGSQVALEHNGDVYACDHFVEEGFKRGNIHETHLADIVECPAQRQFGSYKREGLSARCERCPVREFCHGGCPKNWQLTSPTGEPGLNYLCTGYRRFFTYVQPYLKVFERTVERGLPLPAVSTVVNRLDS